MESATRRAGPKKKGRAGQAKSGRGRYDRAQSAEERFEEQHRRLLEAASEIFAAKGYGRASVEMVVRRAQMSRRTFYEHFESLHDVLLQLYDRSANTLFHAVEEQVRQAADPLEKLQAGIAAFLGLLADHGDLARVLFREIYAAGPEHSARREAVRARFIAFVFEAAAEAHAAGLLGRAPDELTIFAILTALEAVGLRYLERGDEARAPEAVPVLVELAFRAFR